MNILLIAYACEPNKGSEPEVGWQMANQLALAMPEKQFHVITKANNRQSIESENLPDNLKFIYYAPPKSLTFWKNGGRGVRTYYYFWMFGAARFIKNNNIEFDLIHHVTFVNDWLPSLFYILKNKRNKFIWGSIGSHDPISFKFLRGAKQKITETLRISLQLFYRFCDPSFYLCRRKSDYIIGINNNVSTKLCLNQDGRFYSEPAIGMKKALVESSISQHASKGYFSILSVGRLLYIKNFRLSILAFSKFLELIPLDSDVRLEIIGSGSDLVELQAFVVELGIQEMVLFSGKLPLNEVMEAFSKADLFLFPTLENAGFVTLEAMAHSTPVVAMEYGGPQQFVTSNVEKQLVSPDHSYNEIADNLAKLMFNLYKDENLRKVIGEQNRADILNKHTWEAKAQKVKKLYGELLNEK